MIADGLTKGVVDRKAIHEIMNGFLKIAHDIRAWRPKAGARSGPIAPIGEELFARVQIPVARVFD